MINNSNCIDSFRGPYSFLSNFYPCKVEHCNLTFHSAEAAFQAAKLKDPKQRTIFCDLSADAAKRKGRTVPLREDWAEVKLRIMYKIVQNKFKDPELKYKLLLTGDKQLVEGNSWNDSFWGVCNGIGANYLGRILMKVRAELKEVKNK